MRLRSIVCSVIVSVTVAGPWPAPLSAQRAPATPADSARVLADSIQRVDSVLFARKPPFTPEEMQLRRELRRQAAMLYRRAGDRVREGAMLLQFGSIHPSPDTARTYVHAALALARAAGDRTAEGEALLVLTRRHFGPQQYDSVVHYGRQALRIGRELGERWSAGQQALYPVAHAYWRLGQLDSAEAHYHDAVRAARQSGQRSAELLALGDLGNVHLARGRFDSAFVHFHTTLAGFRALGARGGEATWLNNIGGLHNTLGRSDSALVYFRQSLALAREGRMEQLQAGVTGNIGNALIRLGHADSAIAHLNEAASRARRIRDRWTEGNALSSLTWAYQVSGRPDSALVIGTRSLAIMREVGARQQMAGVLDVLGMVHASAGHGDSALAAYGEGLQSARESRSRTEEADLLRHLGDLHARPLPRASLARAVAYYDSAAALLAAIASEAAADQHRVSFAETSTELIDRWALVSLARAGEVGTERSALAALAVAERGRAQALLELMRRGQARDTTGIGNTANTAARPAGADLAQEGAALAAVARTTGAPVLTFLATRDTLLSWLVLPAGEVVVGRTAISRDSAASLVAMVRHDMGADEAGGRALSLVEADPDAAKGATAPARATATTTATSTATSRSSGRASARIALARMAGLALPASIARRLPASGDLVVVAHGPLALVPLAALPVGGAANVLLGERYALRYAPSLATLRAAEERSTAPGARMATRGRALVVGNPTMPTVRSPRGRTLRLPALPGAGREGQWVASALGSALLTGGAATERAVHDRLAAAPVIHLATHGFAYSADARALDSFIALAPDSAAGPDGRADGLLTVGEVLDGAPRLSAELVVLSACQTGLGNLKQAEGTVGLQRAFLARGARSVLVSLWSVSDEATALLMRRFYGHWLQDADRPAKAEALRRAQRDVRATRGFADPRYWAAFQLVGAR